MIGFNWIAPNELAGSSQPGLYDDWGNDIEFLKDLGIGCIASLIEQPILEKNVKQEGLQFFHLPIRDMDAPQPKAASELIINLTDEIKEGKKVLIHCKGGVGRTGMIGACYYVSKGLPAKEAIIKVRKINYAYIQTMKQEEFVHHFEDCYNKQEV